MNGGIIGSDCVCFQLINVGLQERPWDKPLESTAGSGCTRKRWKRTGVPSELDW